MLKHFHDWLLDRGDLAIICVILTIPVLWIFFVAGLVASLKSYFIISKPLGLLIFIVTLLAPMVLYGMYNILRYVYETTVGKS